MGWIRMMTVLGIFAEVSTVLSAVITSQPVDVIVGEGQTAVFQTIFESQSLPKVEWYKAAEPNDILMDAANPRVSTQLTMDARRPIYTATLSIKAVTIADIGDYYGRIENDSNCPLDTEASHLGVKGLTAHWTLDQGDYLERLHKDCVGGHHTQPVGRADFVTGADGRANGAIRISGSEGWARIEGFDPTCGTGELTIGLWANRQEPSTIQQDLWIGPDPNDPSAILANGLKADGRWHHIAAVYEANQVRIYVDAVPTEERPCLLPSSDAILMSIGANADGNEAFGGSLDDIRLYSMALAPSQIAALYEDMVASQEVVDAGAWGVHDPSIIKQGDTFYLFCTGRGVPLRRSKDLYHWESVGRIFSTLPQWVTQAVPGVSNLWAPDISYRNGRYGVYYSASTFGSNISCIGLVSNATLDSSDPNYEWIDEGKVISSSKSSKYNTIDGQVFQDNKGQGWLSFGSFWTGIKLTALDSDTGKPCTPVQLYSIASRPSTAIEAPFIIYRHGYYYLFVSFDSCCQGANSTYNIRVGRSVEVTGPYCDREGVSMTGGGGTLVLEGNQRWKGPGHNAILQDKGQDYLVYHAYDAQNNGRSALRIRPLYWSSDLWPEAGTVITAPVQ